MAWVSVHDNVIGGKLRELAKEIGRTQEEALGILVSLWLWGLNNADKDGKLMSADKDDVLEAFSVKLISSLTVNIVDALVKTRWMEEPEPGALYIHDWDQWQEQWYKAMERREKDAKRKAESRRARPSVEHQSACAMNNGADPSKPHEENVGAQVHIEEPDTKPQPEAPKYAPAFELFWEAYPRRIGKGEAYRKYTARRKDGYSDDELLQAARVYSVQCKRLKTEKQFIKHPKTFLSDSLPFLDYIPKKSAEDTTQGGNPFGTYKEDD